ncbi:MAG: DNA mismatch repair endonuclease MutL [Bacteroidaceae bacterium]|nr:DNA mismatch repair endonuclease MutL [Prevotellaceae bacterium]MDY2850253.1 DNA mismatch repair endonuclease MutL [Bacteroidaceae bacterium]
MSDIIHLLPDSVANQIAAGEVVQRPSSVVKELLENAVDAGATCIELWVTDAGKTCIQVVDNGKGMTETDARLSFERHATSKIMQADDLFNLQTMGFRGEALASITAVSQVELQTRVEGEETGTHLVMEGAKCVEQYPVQCPVGANFIVRNLFYNVPARRRFLKSNTTELNNIMQEFERVVLINSDTDFKFYKDDSLCVDVKGGSFKQRILALFGKAYDKQLLPISVDTSIVRIDGFVGTPQSAKTRGVKQFLFVNGRYMRHPYFSKAIVAAFDRLIPSDKQVSFFVKLSVNPSQIDVNIHPTKTEIKFEDDQAIWQMLLMAVKDSLAKYNVVPCMNFDSIEEAVIPTFRINAGMQEPQPLNSPDYNPFENNRKAPEYRHSNTKGWEMLYKDFGTEVSEKSKRIENTDMPDCFQECGLESGGKETEGGSANAEQSAYVQYGGRYIVTPVKSGLMVIDFVRAHRRILYDSFMNDVKSRSCVSQTLLFPVLIQLSVSGSVIMDTLIDQLSSVGFDINSVGGGSYSVNAIPVATADMDLNSLILGIIDDYDKEGLKKDALFHRLALAISRGNSMNEGRKLDNQEMSSVVDQLFSCDTPNFGPDGKVIISIVPNEIITKSF